MKVFRECSCVSETIQTSYQLITVAVSFTNAVELFFTPSVVLISIRIRLLSIFFTHAENSWIWFQRAQCFLAAFVNDAKVFNLVLKLYFLCGIVIVPKRFELYQYF